MVTFCVQLCSEVRQTRWQLPTSALAHGQDQSALVACSLGHITAHRNFAVTTVKEYHATYLYGQQCRALAHRGFWKKWIFMKCLRRTINPCFMKNLLRACYETDKDKAGPLAVLKPCVYCDRLYNRWLLMPHFDADISKLSKLSRALELIDNSRTSFLYQNVSALLSTAGGKESAPLPHWPPWWGSLIW